jgi:hypothetical protein
MTRLMFGTLAGLAAAALFAVGAGWAGQQTSKDQQPSSQEACMQMMRGAGVTEEGREAMDEFMRSDKAPLAMANMMQMAKRMGNGDVMLGMTKMMEMMGGQGGGMGGRMGGGDRPGARQPGR